MLGPNITEMPIIAGALIVGALWVYTVTDVVLRADWQVRVLRRSTWIALVALVPLVGSAGWLLFGRPRGPVRLPAQRMHPSMLFAPEYGPPDPGSAAMSRAEFMRRFHERIDQQREAAYRRERPQTWAPEDDSV